MGALGAITVSAQTDASLKDFALPEEDRCTHFEECRNPVPGANNSRCTRCLDDARYRDSELGPPT